MAQRISLTDYVTDTAIQPLYDDPGISAGTLFLFDPGHSKGAFSGIPANAATVPNVAASVAAGIVGADASALAGTVAYGRDASNALLLERTGKLGLHGLPSQVNQTTQFNGWWVNLPTAIRDYIFNNVPSHGLYASLWIRKTRDYTGAPTAPQSPMHIHSASAATSNYLLNMQAGVLVPNTGAQLVGRNTPTFAVNTPILPAIAVKDWTGTKPGTSATQLGQFGVGCFGAWASLNINKGAGWVLYRAKFEDLNLTKRTNNGLGGTLAEEYAAALAKDQADFDAAFAVGGKFYGDTWTDPATFA